LHAAAALDAMLVTIPTPYCHIPNGINDVDDTLVISFNKYSFRSLSVEEAADQYAFKSISDGTGTKVAL
jgi:hypothetical protein